MLQTQNKKVYDLDKRTLMFARSCKDFVKMLEKSIAHIEYSKQLIRSSGSVAANYIEASEAISRKDFFHRIRICRKEAKESCLWLRLCFDDASSSLIQNGLIQESTELTKIFGSIIDRYEKNNKLQN